MTILDPLDRITDRVLAYSPEGTPLKVIAGAPEKPLIVGDVEIPCYVLEDETRVLSQQGFMAAVGRAMKAKAGQGASGVDNPPSFLAAKNLQPFIGADLLESATPIRFQPPTGGGPAYGYPALLLPQVCKVYLDARRAEALLPSQQHIAERAEILTLGLANVGIISLVDEATGYERVREERALATILERFLADEFRPWTKTFPFEFYEQIYRLRGWGSPVEGKQHPSVLGHYTNDIVYARVAPGVLDELRQRNPVLPQGWRKNRHHQWFTEEYGHPKLKEHLQGVIVLMRSSGSWQTFRERLNMALPKMNTTLALPMEFED